MFPALRRGVAVAGLATAMVAASAGASAAATRHHGRPHGKSHGKSHSTSHARPKASLHGLVVSAHGSQLVVLAQTAVLGGHTVHQRTEKVLLAAHAPSRHHHRAVRALKVEQGDEISATGVVSGGEIVDGTVQSSAPQPARVVLGTVSTVNGSLITLAAHDRADGHGDGPSGTQNGGDQNGGDQNGGDQNGASRDNNGEHRGESVVVDGAGAAFTGAESSPAALTSGEFLVALGEQVGQDFVAADIVTYNNPPAYVVGDVASADQASNTLTLAVHDGNDGEDGSGTGTPVDTSNALIVVNGAQNGNYPTVGDHVLALGPDGSAGTSQAGTPLAATLVFAFNREDGSPADS